MAISAPEISDANDHCTTLEVAKMLGMAVRSVQLMVDRGELQAWKTPGGHRRISRTSVQQWMQGNKARPAEPANGGAYGSRRDAAAPAGPKKPLLLLIEDSTHFQNLIQLIVQQQFPDVGLQVADDGIAGLALYGQLQPDILIVDILLPGLDGATLITTLRSHSQFARSELIVVTSLDETQRAPYAFALKGVAVIHKPQLVAELPGALQACLEKLRHANA
ncbi:DNA binding domain-containing protein, excisionase family [Paracidovorax valerianellae]|uniref:DNA binding domain-containing protein, excisionase family n=2 Tax=Paracidovorax valerianellae TaxID=187868 RepID=A0A1G6SYQ6_9BURK|nr:response regulator [Paracidovorax valerianellae]SDD21893.1 DNA binding domain-containing protein, excisionase family [Paracidovorax valerianellae]